MFGLKSVVPWSPTIPAAWCSIVERSAPRCVRTFTRTKSPAARSPGWTTAGLPADHLRNSVVESYANVCVMGAPSMARSAARLPPSTLIDTPPFDGVVVSCPTNV